MTIFYIPNPTQYLNLTTTLITINKQQISSLRQKAVDKSARTGSCCRLYFNVVPYFQWKRNIE